MLEEGRAWEDILTELNALQAASHAEDMRALEACALACLRESGQPPEAVMAHIIRSISAAANVTTSPCASQPCCTAAGGCPADRHVRAKRSAT
jgi:hypothetical protein